MFIEILAIYIVYFSVLTCCSYYINLFMSKEQFTREELKHVIPYLLQFWNRLSGSHSIIMIAIVLFLSSTVGIIMPMLTYHWFLNSSILFLGMYLLFPALKASFDRVQVTTGGNVYDTVANIFSKYHYYILIGFGCGTASALMYNWGALKAINFFWFALNFIILSFFIGAEMIKAFKHQ